MDIDDVVKGKVQLLYMLQFPSSFLSYLQGNCFQSFIAVCQIIDARPVDHRPFDGPLFLFCRQHLPVSDCHIKGIVTFSFHVLVILRVFFGTGKGLFDETTAGNG